MTEAVTGHINSPDFRNRADSFRHARKVSELILKVVHGRPDRHVAIRSYDSNFVQNVKQSMIDRGPGQAASMITAFISAVGVNVLARPEVRLPLKSACDQLPKAEREELIGWMAAKFDLGDFSE